jgi:hypothetical protein
LKLVVLLLLAATAVVSWRLARRQSAPDVSYLPSDTARAPQPEGNSPSSPDYLSGTSSYFRGQSRAVYPYSVIPGGVSSIADLKLAVADDPVVARQYQGFNFQKARLVKVAQKESMYVSYRIGKKVFWTRKRIALHPGETLITDGSMTVRTRCGNRVAAVPMDTSSPLEPPEEAFNQPYAALIAAPETMPSNADPGPIPPLPTSVASKSRRWWVLPLFAAPFAALPHSDSASSVPLAVTPEPGLSILLMSGLAGVYWRARKFRGKK